MDAKEKKYDLTNKIRDLVYIAAGAALIAVCSWIAIPLPSGVPVTLQTFAVFAALGLLGGARGTAAVAVYIALGAVGLPVFSGFRGGIGALLGVTGGYIAGFIFSALFYWLITALMHNSIASRIIGMIGGLLVCYVVGTAWFVFAYAKEVGEIGVAAAIMKCVVPFIVPDAGKLIFAFLLSATITKRRSGRPDSRRQMTGMPR